MIHVVAQAMVSFPVMQLGELGWMTLMATLIANGCLMSWVFKLIRNCSL
jgi:hypothetical protein